MHESSYRLMSDFAAKYIEKDVNYKVLDVGSQMIDGQQSIGSYKSIFDNYSNVEYTGCDMVPGLNVDIVLNSPYNWSNIKADSFDFVISGQMLEHVEFPWLTFIEINRVLKPGGICCIIAPSAGFMHNYPLDCYRYYPDGISALAGYASLEVLEAFAEWEYDKYPHLNETWKDCVLIARKRKNTFKRAAKNLIKRKAIHTISKACLLKTEYKTRNPVLKPEKNTVNIAKIYYDTGDGFNEKNTVKATYKLNDKTVNIAFDIDNLTVKGLRFDPLDKACIISNFKIKMNGQTVDYQAKNARIIIGSNPSDKIYLFATNDPIFLINANITGLKNKLELSFDITTGSVELLNSIIKNLK